MPFTKSVKKNLKSSLAHFPIFLIQLFASYINTFNLDKQIMCNDVRDILMLCSFGNVLFPW